MPSTVKSPVNGDVTKYEDGHEVKDHFVDMPSSMDEIKAQNIPSSDDVTNNKHSVGNENHPNGLIQGNSSYDVMLNNSSYDATYTASEDTDVEASPDLLYTRYLSADNIYPGRERKDNVYWKDAYDNDLILLHSSSTEADWLSPKSRASSEHGPDTKDNSLGETQYFDVCETGYSSAPETGYRSAPEEAMGPREPRRSRGRSRSRLTSRDWLYYKERSRSVSRTRSAFVRGPRRPRSLNDLSRIPHRHEVRKAEDIITEQEDEDEEEEEEEKSKTIGNATTREKISLACLAVADCNAFMCLALMAPFFPKEAENRGVASSQNGWIFGIFALTQCIASPFIGKILPYVGARFTFLAGNFFAGGCTMLFGALDYISPADTTTFVAFSFVVRISLALGCTALACAIFAMATSTFRENPAFVLGLLESAIGVGLTAGPALGGFLYGALGFKGPFFVVGGVILATTPIFALIMDAPPPTVPSDDDSTEVKSEREGLFRRLLCIPSIVMVLLATFMAAVLWIILDPILEPQLRKFHLSSSALGAVFLLLSGTYAILAPLVGKLADSMVNSTPLMIIGFVVTSFGMLLLGPSALIGLQGVSVLWLNLVAMLVIGVGVSFAVVPSFDKMLDAAERAEIIESFHLHGIIGGLWTSVYALGEFVGPTLAGWVVGIIEFDEFMTYTAIASFLTAIILAFLWIYESLTFKKLTYDKTGKKIDENTPLIISLKSN